MPEQPPVPTEPVPVPEPPAVVMPDPVPPPAPSGVNWDMVSALANWTAALTTIGAVVVAAVAAYWTIQTNRAQQKTLDLQREQWQRQQDMDRREQAKHVTFFMDATWSRKTPSVKIFNASPYQIDLCFLVSIPPEKEGDSNFWEVLAFQGNLLPTGTEPAELLLNKEDAVRKGHMYDLHLFFVDVNGVEWIRKATGALRETTAEEEALLGGALNRRRLAAEKELAEQEEAKMKSE